MRAGERVDVQGALAVGNFSAEGAGILSKGGAGKGQRDECKNPISV
jgi:hypothetical protein